MASRLSGSWSVHGLPKSGVGPQRGCTVPVVDFAQKPPAVVQAALWAGFEVSVVGRENGRAASRRHFRFAGGRGRWRRILFSGGFPRRDYRSVNEVGKLRHASIFAHVLSGGSVVFGRFYRENDAGGADVVVDGGPFLGVCSRVLRCMKPSRRVA